MSNMRYYDYYDDDINVLLRQSSGNHIQRETSYSNNTNLFGEMQFQAKPNVLRFRAQRYCMTMTT